MQPIGSVAALWRYPVKSMGGEVCDALSLDGTGVEGDRRYAFESSEAPVGKPLLSSAQRTALIPLQAQLHHESTVPFITGAGDGPFPLTDPQLLSRLTQRLCTPIAPKLRHNPDRPFTDVRPISLHSIETIAHLSRELGQPIDARRLRSNIHLDLSSGEPFAEDHLTNRALRIGDTATLRITERVPRCRIVALDPDTAEADRTLLNHLARHHQGRAGIYATVLTGGTVHLGDTVIVLD